MFKNKKPPGAQLPSGTIKVFTFNMFFKMILNNYNMSINLLINRIFYKTNNKKPFGTRPPNGTIKVFKKAYMLTIII